MADLSWRDAILAVLREEKAEMHYAHIAQAVYDRGCRTSVGVKPVEIVASTISTQLGDEVRRTRRGYYVAAEYSPLVAGGAPGGEAQTEPCTEVTEDAAEMGFIRAFGMFWRRAEVHWQGTSTQLLGVQQLGSQAVNFAEQAGVYILYDAGRVVYVGRVTKPRFSGRLWEHTRDRLAGRWDTFSWFGVRAAADDGGLGPLPGQAINPDTLIATMEALLIEGLEPPQNRRQGDGFNAMEFLQKTDPNVDYHRQAAVLDQLRKAIRPQERS